MIQTAYGIGFILLFWNLTVLAQSNPGNSDVTKNLNQKSLEEFGVKKDSIKSDFSLPPAEKPAVNSTKSLNALEKEKIQSVDVKSKSVVNKDSIYMYYKKKWEDSVALAEKNKVPATNPVKNSKSTTPVKSQDPLKAEEPQLPGKPKVPAKTDDGINTKPVIKTTKPEKPVKQTPLEAEEPQLPGKPATKPKTNLDSMLKKPLKDFSFDTQPIISGKNTATYSPDKPAKPEPKTFTNSKLTLEQEKQRLETYNSYQREADSVRYKNSVLAALQVKAPITVDPNDYIEIYLNGGGLISGSDPKLTDRVSIFQSGVVQREYTTRQQGDTRYEKKISREELRKLAQYIADMGFFDFKASYACGGDGSCLNRIKQIPAPKPMTITVAIGKRRHTVNVDIFAPGEKNWVSYPNSLEKIIDAIKSVAEK
jgi:hypothetical protein